MSVPAWWNFHIMLSPLVSLRYVVYFFGRHICMQWPGMGDSAKAHTEWLNRGSTGLMLCARWRWRCVQRGAVERRNGRHCWCFTAAARWSVRARLQQPRRCASRRRRSVHSFLTDIFKNTRWTFLGHSVYTCSYNMQCRAQAPNVSALKQLDNGYMP